MGGVKFAHKSQRLIFVQTLGQVPSGFYLADGFLKLDRMFSGSLLVPTTDLSKADLAAREAKRIKRLMGALRHLFRNSPLPMFQSSKHKFSGVQ